MWTPFISKLNMSPLVCDPHEQCLGPLPVINWNIDSLHLLICNMYYLLKPISCKTCNFSESYMKAGSSSVKFIPITQDRTQKSSSALFPSFTRPRSSITFLRSPPHPSFMYQYHAPFPKGIPNNNCISAAFHKISYYRRRAESTCKKSLKESTTYPYVY